MVVFSDGNGKKLLPNGVTNSYKGKKCATFLLAACVLSSGENSPSREGFCTFGSDNTFMGKKTVPSLLALKWPINWWAQKDWLDLGVPPTFGFNYLYRTAFTHRPVGKGLPLATPRGKSVLVVGVFFHPRHLPPLLFGCFSIPLRMTVRTLGFYGSLIWKRVPKYM